MANLPATNLPDHHAVIDLDHRTSAAVCTGIGHHLRNALAPTDALPEHLQKLMQRLKDVDDTPSIVPGIADSI